MEIVNIKNREEVDALNKAILKAKLPKVFEVIEFETDTEVGMIVKIPPIVKAERSHYSMVIKANYKEAPGSFSQVVEVLNNDMSELLYAFKQEFLKIVSCHTKETGGIEMKIKYFLN